MSAVVRMVSSFMRSTDCTTLLNSRWSCVGEIARLRDRRHHEMHLDQPGDRLGLRRREAEPRQKLRDRAPAIEWSSMRPLAMSCRNSVT